MTEEETTAKIEILAYKLEHTKRALSNRNALIIGMIIGYIIYTAVLP